jgi:hypothetical protein
MQKIKNFSKTLLFAILSVCFALSLFIIYIYFILVHIGDGDRTVNDIHVPGMLSFLSWKYYKINYSKLLEKAMMDDEKSIRRLVLLNFDGANGYAHGAVIVDLIEIIGEDKFIQSLTTIHSEPKRNVTSHIRVGLEYGGNPNFKGKTLEEAFPKIYALFN